MNLEIFDEFLKPKLYFDTVRFAQDKARYKWGEYDHQYAPPTGVVADFTDNLIYPFDKIVEATRPYISDNLSLKRIYINCFAPREIPTWHTDSSVPGHKTTLIYLSTTNWSLENGGETQFWNSDKNTFSSIKGIIGVPPISNRCIIFPSEIIHRATSFHNNWRFSLATKWE